MAISQEPLDLQNSKPGTNRTQIMTNKIAYKNQFPKSRCQLDVKQLSEVQTP